MQAGGMLQAHRMLLVDDPASVQMLFRILSAVDKKIKMSKALRAEEGQKQITFANENNEPNINKA
jgi:hypothetical protein